ncbi:MAG: polyamine ABC transporter substrate-binding protein [Hyphomicrobiales bacterium]|nr:polyamine ABC transporter substrate-binding protein [Hyphomicrobiales bacterium]
MKLSACFAALAIAASSVAFAQEKTLVIAGTGGASQDAARKAWYEPFSKEMGVRVVEDEYDQKLSQIRAQIEANNVKWDVATVPILVLYAGCAEGMFEKVEWNKLLNPADFGEPLSPCGVPVVNSSGVLVYDADRIKDGPKTWADFWNVAKWPGKRGLWYGPQETLEVALMADGVPPAKVMEVLAGPGGVDRAFAKLDELKPNIQWWKSGSESLQLLGSGETVMSYAWNGRVAAANQADKKHLRMVWDAGHVNGSSHLVILKGAPHKQTAIDFIKYAASAPAQARYAEAIPYGPPNTRALDLVPATLRDQLPTAHLATAQPQNTQAYADFWTEHEGELSERFARWVSK